MSLYEINKKMAEAWEKLEEAGEAEYLEAFEKLELERSEKIGNTARLVKNLESLAAQIGAEAKALSERKKALENKAEYLRKYLNLCLKPGEKYEDSAVKVSWRKSERLKLEDEDLVPDLYVEVERKIRKDEIKKDLKAGADLGFASLVEFQNLQIK